MSHKTPVTAKLLVANGRWDLVGSGFGTTAFAAGNAAVCSYSRYVGFVSSRSVVGDRNHEKLDLEFDLVCKV